MFAFPVGSDTTFSVPYTDNADAPVTPTGASYQIMDGEGEFLTDPINMVDVSGANANITVPAATYPQPGGYTLVVTINVGSQTFVKEVMFGIFAVTRLVPLENSFQTISQAIYHSSVIPNMTSFTAASDAAKISALIEAFIRITRFNFTIPWPEVMDLQDRLSPDWVAQLTPRMWPLMTADLYKTYPSAFRVALNRAQIIEANDILTVDRFADRRRAGLMSESIGESSMMFKSGVRPLDLGCARATYEALTGWLDNRVTLTRS